MNPRTPATPDVASLGILAVCINLALMVVKVAAGLLGNSQALVADGLESASDVVSSLMTWTGFHVSLKPADEDHPYGHGKVEALAGLFSGTCLLAAAGVIAYQSIQEIRTPHHLPAWYTLPVLLAVIAIKEVLYRRILKTGAELDSTALIGDAWHHRADAITSAAAAIGIGVALVGGKGYEMADDWAALAACLVIAGNGVMIWRRALHDVLDGSVPMDLMKDIDSVAASTPGVLSTEKCRVRKSGIHLLVDIHVRVPRDMTVFEGHRISHEVKDRLMTRHPRIADVTIHIEPA